MTRDEIIARSAELRVQNVLEELERIVFGKRLPQEDPLARYADPEPPQGITLPGWKRSRWARRLLGR